VIWDFAGDEVPAADLAGLEGLADRLPDRLGELLTRQELERLHHRAAELSTSGTFPCPDGDRPYPWPLV
jgi:hypothetical protein